MGIFKDFISLCPTLENLINTVRPFEPSTGSFSGRQATKLKLRLRLVFCLGSAWALHVPASLNSSFALLGLIKCPGTVRTKLKLRLRLVSYLGSACALHVPASLNSSFALLGLIKCPGTVRTKLKLRLRLVFVKCST